MNFFLFLRYIVNYIGGLRVSFFAYLVIKDKLTYLGKDKLHNIEYVTKKILKYNIQGSFIECGVAGGGSALVISNILRGKRKLFLYDVFGMIPPPGANASEFEKKRFEEITKGESKGINGDMYYGYQQDLQSLIVSRFKKMKLETKDIVFNVGLFQETLFPKSKIALAHIDCDWYDSTKVCLERVSPYLSEGGFFIIDDYNTYEGSKVATDEFMKNNRDTFNIVSKSSNLVIRKKFTK